MAQNITLLGASYSAVPAVVLPKTGGGTARFDDASITTATASDVASGKIFLANDGTITTGTSSGGGGASSWTKIAETSYQVNNSNTSATNLDTWSTGHSEIWTSDKIVYIRVRDTEGKRRGYYYGTDVFFINHVAKNNSESSATSGNVMIILSVTSTGTYYSRYGYSTTGYGIYPNYFYSDGRIRFGVRYNATYSKTINSTYKVEVYLLDPAGGVSIFT